MYILKPEKGFVIPVIYVKNEILYINNSIDINSKLDRNNVKYDNLIMDKENLEVETRDRLFDEEDEVDIIKEDRKIDEISYKSNDENLGKLVFDDYDESCYKTLDSKNEEDFIHANMRTTTEVEVEKVGNITINEDDDCIENSKKNLDLEDHINEEIVKSKEETYDSDCKKNIRITDENVKDSVYEKTEEDLENKKIESSLSNHDVKVN